MCVLIKVLCRNTDVLSFFVVCLPHIRYNLYSSRIQGWLDLQLGFREVEPELTSSASQISNFILAPSWIIHRYAQSQSSSMVMLDAPASPGINSVIHVAVGGAFHPFAQSPPRAVLDTYVSSRYLIFPSIKRFPNSRSRQRGGSGEKFHEFLGYSDRRGRRMCISPEPSSRTNGLGLCDSADPRPLHSPPTQVLFADTIST